MKKAILKLVLGMAFCFLCFVGSKQEVKADVIFWPDDEFQWKNETTTVEERDYYEVTAEGVDVYETPDADTPYDRISKGETYFVYWVHEDENKNLWGCIGGNFWIPMKGMANVYNHEEFVDEHFMNVGSYYGELDTYELVLPLQMYEYPGGAKTGKFSGKWCDFSDGAQWLVPELVYTAADGTLWGYVDCYNRGYVEGWYCISDLPQNAVRDYDKNGAVDLSDAQTVLKAALKIENRVKYTLDNVEYGYTLKDAQMVLKAALKISYDVAYLRLPEEPMDDVVDEPLLNEVPVTSAGVDVLEMYKEILADYPCYSGDYIALDKDIPHISEEEKEELADYLAEVKGKEVIWTGSMEQLVEDGYGRVVEHPKYSMYDINVLQGTLMNILFVNVWENDTMEIRGTISKGMGIGQDYWTTYEKQDDKWVRTSQERIYID